jgi:fucose permease
MSATETVTLPAQSATAAGPSRSKVAITANEEGIELQSVKSGKSRTLHDELNVRDELPPPNTAVEVLERWNYPRKNMWGIFGTYLSFFILGMNDATPGALIPYLETYYDLSYTVVSLLFLSPCVGYTLAASLNNSVHRLYGQRGVAFIAGSCHFVTYLTFSLHPPWPVMVVFFIFAGFGNGLADAGWCAWTGNMASANKVQGFLQAFYSLGATISPLVATSMITKGNLPWYNWYYVMVRSGEAVSLEWRLTEV